MKKLLSISLCLAMVLALAAGAFAISLGPISGGGFSPMPDLTTAAKTVPADSEAGQWIAKVESIGEVTLEDKVLIEECEAIWDEPKGLGSLTSIYKREYQDVKDAYEVLKAARKAYNTLAAAQPTEPTPANLTLSFADPAKTLEVEAGKWIYNEEVTSATASGYQVIVLTKDYKGELGTNGYGVAIVLDKDNKMIKIYDGTAPNYLVKAGEKQTAHFTTATYATTAWSELQEGETLVIFPNDGGANGNVARGWAYGLRGMDGKDYFGKVLTITGLPTVPETPDEPTVPTEPTPSETQPSAPATEPSTPATEPSETTPADTTPADTTPSTPSTPVDPNGDGTFMVVALAVLSMTALVVLVSKKRAF